MERSARKRHPRVRALILWGGALLVVLLLAVLLAVLGGREVETVAVPTPETEPHVDIVLDARIIDASLRIQGSTDLPDGSLISYEVHQVDDARLDFRAEGHAEVDYGRFEEWVDISAWPPGDVEVFLAFPSSLGGVEQPEEATRLVGERGEGLSGPNVTHYDDGARLEKLAVVQWRGPGDPH